MGIRVFVRQKPDRENLLLYYSDPDSGREISRSAGTSDRKEAERAAARLEQELEKTRGADGTKWEHFRQRFEDEKLAALSPKGRKAYNTALNHFRRLVKVDSLSAVTAGTVSLFQAAMLREKHPLTSIATHLRHIRGALNWAEAVGMLGKAPKVREPKTGRRKLMRGRPITVAEYANLKEHCPDNQWRRFMDLLWLSGLRLSEAVRLSWDRPPIRVVLDNGPHPHIEFMGEGQKSREDAVTAIPQDFAYWLAETAPSARTGRVVPLLGQKGRQMAPNKIGDRLSEIGLAAGVLVNDKDKPASAHDFRRAYGTRWAALVRPVTLQRMMRHKSIETTLRYYVNIETSDVGAELWGPNVPKIVPSDVSDWQI